MPADTNPYGGVFGGWLMGQMGLACGSFASRRTQGKAILVAADAVKFPGAMAVGDELSVYVELLNEGRTSLRLKAAPSFVQTRLLVSSKSYPAALIAVLEELPKHDLALVLRGVPEARNVMSA